MSLPALEGVAAYPGIDPEIAAYVDAVEAFYPADAARFSVQQNRDWYDRFCKAFSVDMPEGIAVEDTSVRATGPAREIPVRRYLPSKTPVGPALLFFHGGGFVVVGLDSHDNVCAEISARTGRALTAVDYRLAPEHPYPAALDDAEAAYLDLAADDAPVAALCLRARRKGLVAPKAQVQIYPMLGNRCSGGSFDEHADAPLLSTAGCEAYLALYAGDLGAVRGDAEFAPLNAQSCSGLPPAFIFAAGLDPLRDDATGYAAQLAAAGVFVDCRVDDGLVHGHLRARHRARAAKNSFDAICGAIARAGV